MTGQKVGNRWTVYGILILLWALFPLLWMLSLSFKDPSTFRSALVNNVSLNTVS